MTAVTAQSSFTTLSSATKMLEDEGFISIDSSKTQWMSIDRWATIKQMPASKKWLVQIGVLTEAV